MAPKKKGKMNKLAKMSDEERARYMQHRADMEEEARRRKAELISRFMNNKLQKEEAFSKTNTAKLNQQWRYILRKIKCQQQAQDIQGLISTFDFMVERKNNLLTTLMKAIEEADEQYRRMTQAHMETINQFLEIGTERLVNIQDEYDTQRNTLLVDWDKEYTELTGNHDKAEYNLRLLIFIKNEEMEMYKKQSDTMVATVKNDAKLAPEERLQDITSSKELELESYRNQPRGIYAAYLEHHSSIQEERIQDLTRPKELELESYWNQLRGVYTTYLEQHSPIMNHYNTLREKDDFYKRDIARNSDKITCMNEILLSLQKEWNHAGARMAHRLRKMSQEKEETSNRYWELKKSTKTEKIKSEDHLTVVVNASQDAIEKLQKTKNKLEKILQMAEICGKYETDEDQQIMITGSDHTNNDQTAAGEYEHLNEDMIAECEELKKLDKFYLKVNRVKVQTITLRTERDKLSKENEQLKNYMKKHLTELALQSGKDRPSTTMYYKTDSQKAEALNLKSSWNNRPVTCIEGALSNAVLHEKRMKVEQRSRADRRVRSYPRLCWH